jgi:hypothetical protein
MLNDAETSGFRTKNNLSLVPQSPLSLEGSGPAAHSILSRMIADALALAKEPQFGNTSFTVLTSTGPLESLCRSLIKRELEPRFEARFLTFESEKELMNLARSHPFDLIVVYLFNVRWECSLEQSIKILTRLKHQYLKPIIAHQGLNLTNKFEGTGILFFQTPFLINEFLPALKSCLRSLPPEHRQI